MKKNNKNNKVPINNQNSYKKLSYGLIIILVLALVVGIFFWYSGRNVVGQAYMSKTPVDVTSITAGKAVFLQYASGVAQKGDKDVVIPVYIKSVIAGNEQGLGLATLCLKYDPTKLKLINAVVTKNAWTWLGKTSQQAVAALSNQGQGVGKCVGYSVSVDLSKTDTGAVISTNANGEKVADLTFEVIGDYTNGVPIPIELKTTYISGLLNPSGDWEDKIIAATSKSDLLIAHVCPDVDLDGWPSIDPATKDDLVLGKDLRACANPSTKDCDDNNKAINPAAQESCNGIDDNCVGGADEGVGTQAVLNTPPKDPLTNQPYLLLYGVCAGKQVCKGAAGWANSYVTDPNYVVETCDFYDNDCDGQVNEGVLNCAIGGSVPKGLAIPGNMYIEYTKDPFTGNYDYGTQDIKDLDVSLLLNYLVARDVNSKDTAGNNIGSTGQKPYQAFLKGQLLWVCDDGTYYIKSADTFVYKQKYDLQKIKTTFTSNVNNDLMNGVNPVLC